MFYPEDHVSQLNNLEGRYLHDVGVEPTVWGVAGERDERP